MNEPYSALASHYDLLMQDFDYQGYTAFLKHRLKGREGLDLACGSGRITIALSQAGFQMTGMDQSPEMLNHAREQAAAARERILFARCALQTFEVAHPVDFVTCTVDGVNYLKPREIPAFFARVYAALKPGGVFLFDVSTAYKLTQIIASNVFFEDRQDITYVWSNNCTGSGIDMDIVLFERGEDGRYMRREEHQHQYVHQNQTLATQLEKAGFIVKTYDGAFGALQDDSERAVFEAVKK